MQTIDGWALWVPITSILIGWFLNEVSQLFRARRQDRRPFARALADLLEIRHRALVLPAALDRLAEHLPIPEAMLREAMPLVEQALPDITPARSRYDSAVSLISEIDPVEAFRMRSKDLVASLDELVAPLLEARPDDRHHWFMVKREVLQLTQGPLEKVILRVARKVGWRTWLRTQRVVRKPVTLPAEFDDLLQKASTALQQVNKGQPAT